MLLSFKASEKNRLQVLRTQSKSLDIKLSNIPSPVSKDIGKLATCEKLSTEDAIRDCANNDSEVFQSNRLQVSNPSPGDQKITQTSRSGVLVSEDQKENSSCTSVVSHSNSAVEDVKQPSINSESSGDLTSMIDQDYNSNDRKCQSLSEHSTRCNDNSNQTEYERHDSKSLSGHSARVHSGGQTEIHGQNSNGQVGHVTRVGSDDRTESHRQDSNSHSGGVTRVNSGEKIVQTKQCRFIEVEEFKLKEADVKKLYSINGDDLHWYDDHRNTLEMKEYINRNGLQHKQSTEKRKEVENESKKGSRKMFYSTLPPIVGKSRTNGFSNVNSSVCEEKQGKEIATGRKQWRFSHNTLPPNFDYSYSNLY